MVQPSFQNQQLIKNSEEKDQLMNLEDTMSNLRQQVGTDTYIYLGII